MRKRQTGAQKKPIIWLTWFCRVKTLSGVGDVPGTRVSVCRHGAHECAEEKASFIVCNPEGMTGIVESQRTVKTLLHGRRLEEEEGGHGRCSAGAHAPTGRPSKNSDGFKVCVTALSPGPLAMPLQKLYNCINYRNGISIITNILAESGRSSPSIELNR